MKTSPSIAEEVVLTSNRNSKNVIAKQANSRILNLALRINVVQSFSCLKKKKKTNLILIATDTFG